MQTVYYTIYQVTNLINDKIYIGKHQTKDLNDGYMGSGKLIRQAIDKYGVENFSKEILFVFDHEDEMNTKEAELVTEDFVSQETNYNLCAGGKGGFSYINNELSDKMKHVRRNNLAKIPKEVLRENGRVTGSKYGGRHGFTREQNIINAARAWNDDARERRMKTWTERKFQQGENNSQFGTRWITDGNVSKKIKKTESVPEGWYLGRTPESKKNI